MEPKAVNTLQKEAEALRETALKQLEGIVPVEIESWFGERSKLFLDEVLAQWRRDGRYDELIDYITYQYEETGGEEFWQQVLVDLRLRGDEQRSMKLLDGLYTLRFEKFIVALKNSRKFSDNYLASASLVIAQGEVLKILYEKAFILENKPLKERNVALIKSLSTEINRICESDFA